MPRIRATREDAQAFVGSLKDFSDTLPPAQQAMLGTILDAAQQDDTAGYGRAMKRSETDPTAGQDDTAGYGRKLKRSETDQTAEQDDTAGYARRPPRTETPSQDDDGRWEQLVEWLGGTKGSEDETEGFARNR